MCLEQILRKCPGIGEIAEVEQLVQRFPNSGNAHAVLGQLRLQRGKDEETAVSDLRNAIRLGADSRLLNAAAWVLATAPGRSTRHAALSVELAEEALKRPPSSAGHLNTLGVALYRSGQFEKALAVLMRSAEQQKGGKSSDWFFIAMAQRRLGQQSAAQQSLLRAIEWMEANRPDDEELRRFREEAQALFDAAEPD